MLAPMPPARRCSLRLLWLGALAATLAAGSAETASAAAPKPFGHTCKAHHGVRFCPTTTLSQRVPSFDGHPIDIDVTLPARGNGPFPTILMLHAFGQNKDEFEAITPAGRPLEGVKHEPKHDTLFYNNNFYAKRGYAVINYSERGWGNSCGFAASRTSPACDQGWWHFADQRFEVRDAQYLLGLLVDERIVDPEAIGVTGESWGSGQTVQLAFLRDKVRLMDGSFMPWRSPNGTPLHITAAHPRWMWSDLGSALLPNGRFLTNGAIPGPTIHPPGILGTAYANLFIIAGSTKGYIAPEGADPTADPIGLFGIANRGEPYGSSLEQPLNQLRIFSGVTTLAPRAAPLLVMNGWNDDLFPPLQGIRTYEILRDANPNARVSLQLGDVGHPVASNKRNTYRVFNLQAARFFDHYLLGKGPPPRPGGVTAMTTTCPPNSPGAGPYRAPSLDKLSRGELRFGGARTQTVTSNGGSLTVSRQITPITGTLTPCNIVEGVVAPGTANYARRVRQPFTMLGLPEVTAQIDTRGLYGQIDAHLWDLWRDKKGERQQRLVSRVGVRITRHETGELSFQLSGNGYRFRDGHTIRLELAGRDPNFRRPSNGSFRIRVSDLEIVVPTLER